MFVRWDNSLLNSMESSKMSKTWFETEAELMNQGVFADMQITPKKKKAEKFMSFEEACTIIKACVDSEIEWIEVEENNPEDIKKIKKAWRKVFEIAREHEKGWE